MDLEKTEEKHRLLLLCGGVPSQEGKESDPCEVCKEVRDDKGRKEVEGKEAEEKEAEELVWAGYGSL